MLLILPGLLILSVIAAVIILRRAGGGKFPWIQFYTKGKESGFNFSSSDVVGLLVFTEQNGHEKKITLESVKAVAAKGPQMPDWLGKRPPVDGKWALTFKDDFDGNTLDMTKWNLPNIKEDITEETFPIEIEGEKSWWGSPSIVTFH